jgi:hypothetical protein
VAASAAAAAVNAASLSLMKSYLPWNGPIGCVRIGLIDNVLKVNPSVEEMANSTLDFVFAGTDSRPLMIETLAQQVPEETIKQAMVMAHEAVRDIIATQRICVAAEEAKKQNDAEATAVEYRDPKRWDEVLGRVTSHHHAKPWASIWSGKQVVFGHDARRGLQIHFDTGACYGKYLTGIILPSKTIVSVPSKKNYAHAHRNL